MPYTIKELTKVLGYTEDQIRVRLGRFAESLQGHIRKGRFNRIEVDDNGLVILRRAQQLEAQYGDLRTVRNLLQSEIQSGVPQGRGNTVLNEPKQGLVDQTKLIEALEREIEHLREEVAFLRRRVEELTPLALPRPRRRWFSWLLPGAKRERP